MEQEFDLFEKPRAKTPWDDKPLIARCTSIFCDRIAHSDAISGGVEKKVSLNTVFCPDCGHALFWTKLGKGINNFV